MEVKKRLRAEIERTGPDGRIRSRAELVAGYGVSRTTIDRAISELIGEGALYTRNGSGTYVTGVADLAAGSSPVRSWGVLLPDIRHYNYPGILRGIEDVGLANTVNIMVGNTDNLVRKQTSYLDNFVRSRASGIVIIPARPDPAEAIETRLSSLLGRLHEEGIPFVFCNRSVSGVEAPRVVTNDFHGGYLATRHLLERGYRRIAYVAHPRYSISLDRCQGYMSALVNAGVAVDEALIAFSESWGFETPGHEEMGRLLDGPRPPDAVVCFTDLIASGACRAIAEHGLRPGRDIGVVGYDDSMVCEMLPVKLTSVRVQSYEMGREAARLLLRMVAGEPVDPRFARILMPELVVRQSTERNAGP